MMKAFYVFLTIILGLNIHLYSQDFPDDFCLCEKQTIASEVLNQDRILFVYLPVDYNEDTTKTDLKTEHYRFLYSSVGTNNDTDTFSFRELEKIIKEKETGQK